MYDLSFFFFKQKTAYEMRISDWSSDVCSSDLHDVHGKADNQHRCPLLLPVGPGCDGSGHREQSGQRDADRQYPQHRGGVGEQIGRASCRERVCQYVSISVVAVSLKKKQRVKRGRDLQKRHKIQRKKEYT